MSWIDIHYLLKSMNILKIDEMARFECDLTMACRELSNFQEGWIYCWERDDLRGVWSVTNKATHTKLIEFNETSLGYWNAERIVAAISDAESPLNFISRWREEGESACYEYLKRLPEQPKRHRSDSEDIEPSTELIDFLSNLCEGSNA